MHVLCTVTACVMYYNNEHTTILQCQYNVCTVLYCIVELLKICILYIGIYSMYILLLHTDDDVHIYIDQ